MEYHQLVLPQPYHCKVLTALHDHMGHQGIDRTLDFLREWVCCNMGQNDTIDKIELIPSIVLSSDNTNCKNDIQLFHQLFDELSVYRDYH